MIVSNVLMLNELTQSRFPKLNDVTMRTFFLFAQFIVSFYRACFSSFKLIINFATADTPTKDTIVAKKLFILHKSKVLHKRFFFLRSFIQVRRRVFSSFFTLTLKFFFV